MVINVRAAREDDRERLHRLGEKAFSESPTPFDLNRDRSSIPLERRLVATDGDDVLGTLSVWEFSQWFGGRKVPMGGVAGVAVEPAYRGRGAASVLLRAALECMRGRGEVLSTLFPMNHRLYRHHGWELAGGYPEYEASTRGLTELPRPNHAVQPRPVRDDDLPGLMTSYDAIARHEPGQVAPNSVYAAQRMLPSAKQEAYLVEKDGVVTGALAFTHARPVEVHEIYSLSVRHFAAADVETELALWRLLASHHPVARTVRFVAPPTGVLPQFLGERDVKPIGAGWSWMTRLVDAAGAVAARGYPDWCDVEVHLHVTDTVAPWNAGPRVLRVHGGNGVLEPGGEGRVRLSAGHLAALYTGWSNPRQLANWGFLSGGTRKDLDALTVAFSGPVPWIRHFF